MTHLLQLVTHLLDTCPKSEVYPTCKSIVMTDESFIATSNSYVVIYNLHIWSNFWFCPNLAWYYNMYPTSKPFVATDELFGALNDLSVAIND